DERLTRVLINGADLVKRPDPPLSNRRAGTCHDATGVVRHDHLTNAMACRLVRCPPIHRETKKAPAVPGLEGTKHLEGELETPRSYPRAPITQCGDCVGRPDRAGAVPGLVTSTAWWRWRPTTARGPAANNDATLRSSRN